MTVQFQCPQCGSRRSVPEVMSGRRVRCPACDALVEIVPLPEEPGADESSAAVSAAPLELTPGDEVFTGPAAAPEPRRPTPPPPRAPEGEDDPPPPAPRRSQLVETEMDMTPMVDATFQLLIFFMITAAFALQKSKEIPRPQSDEASTNVVQQEEEEAANAVVVRIDENSSYLVINADGDEEEAPAVVDLHAKLRKAREGDSEGRVPNVLRVEVHDEALHERVIAALDAGNGTGFGEVQLASWDEDS